MADLAVYKHDFAVRIAPLLTEYSHRLVAAQTTLRDSVNQYENAAAKLQNWTRTQHDLDMARLRYQLLKSDCEAARELGNAVLDPIRRASQYLEHEVENELDKLEVQARLQDLEAAMRALEKTLEATSSWFMSVPVPV